MVQVVVEESHKGTFSQVILNGRHAAAEADVGAGLGGRDLGPTPYDKLMSALGSCTSMTLKMYADVKKWPLEGVDITLTHHKEKDPVSGEFIDVLTRDITITGPLDDAQKKKLIDIANKCPIHRTLEGHPEITTGLTPKTAEDAAMSTDPGPRRAKPKFSVKEAHALRGITVSWKSGEGRFTQEVTAGGHVYKTDEPHEIPGGLDKGPNPYEELMAALGACTSMKVRRVAEEKGIPLKHVSVGLETHKEKDAGGKVVDKIAREITLSGNLTEDQRQLLLEAANHCPIFETLKDGPKIVTNLVNGPAAPAVTAPPPAAPRM